MMAMQMKDSGIEWIGEIPEDWEVRRIKHLIAFPLQYGANETGEDFDEMLPRYIRITDISANNELKNDGKLSLSNDKAKGYILQDGDVLFARSGATVGKTFYYKGEYGLACFAGYMIRLSADSSKISGRFIYYYTLSKAYAEWTNMIFIQATIQNISAEKYSELHMPVPPLPQQEKIIRFLDSRCAEIDAVIAAKQRQNELLKEQRQSIIFEAVTKGLDPTVTYKDSGVDWIGEIPEDWEVRKIKYVARMKSGESITAALIDEQGKYPVYGGNGLRGFAENFTHDGRYILIGRQGALCGNVHLVEGKFWASEHAVVVDVFEEYLVDWFDNVLQAMNLNQYSESAAQPGISVDRVLNLSAPVPPKKMQETMVAFLNAKCAELDRVVAANNAVIDKLKEYRQSLIYEAVTGKIAV